MRLLCDGYKIDKSCKKITDFGRNGISAAEYGLFWCGKREPEGRKKPSAMMAFFLTAWLYKDYSIKSDTSNRYKSIF